MNEKILISSDVINNTHLGFLISLKIFLFSLVLIPWAFLVQFFYTIINIFKIPGSVIDTITLCEKVKILIKEKQNAAV